MELIKKYQKIRTKFSAVFGGCTLTNNKFNYDTMNYKDIISLTDDILNFYIKVESKSVQLYDLITRLDVIDIIVATIESYVLIVNGENNETIHLNTFKDYDKFFKLLDENLQNIPMLLTTVLIPIPFAPNENCDILISNNITLAVDSQSDYEDCNSIPRFGLMEWNSKPENKISILKFSYFGFPSKDINSNVIQSVLSQYKSLIMACKILGLVEFNHDMFKERKLLNFFVSDGKEKKIKHPLPLSINESMFATNTKEFSARDYFNNSKNSIGLFFNNSRDDKKIICASLAWLFDSYFSDGLIKSIINLSVSIESLLADENKQKATEALVSKFAYSIGPLPSVRNFLKKEMEDFYSIRSNIIHGRNLKSLKEAQEKLITTRYFFEKELKNEINCLINPEQFIVRLG